MTITILILIYILSCYFGWRWIHIAYSRGGIWHGLKISYIELFIIFMPFMNYITVPIIYLMENPSNNSKESYLERFFRIKH